MLIWFLKFQTCLILYGTKPFIFKMHGKSYTDDYGSMFFGPNQLIFPPKHVPCRFSLNLLLFGLGPSSKDLGTNLKLSTNNIIA